MAGPLDLAALARLLGRLATEPTVGALCHGLVRHATALIGRPVLAVRPAGDGETSLVHQPEPGPTTPRPAALAALWETVAACWPEPAWLSRQAVAEHLPACRGAVAWQVPNRYGSPLLLLVGLTEQGAANADQPAAEAVVTLAQAVAPLVEALADRRAEALAAADAEAFGGAGLAWLAADGRLLAADPTFCEVLQTELDQLLGRGWQALLAGGDVARLTTSAATAGDRPPARFACRQPAASGPCRRLDSQVEPVWTNEVPGATVLWRCQRTVSDQPQPGFCQHRDQLRGEVAQMLATELRFRTHLAWDLHAQVAQPLAAANLAVSRGLTHKPDTATRQLLDEVRECLREAIAQTRQVCFELSPTTDSGDLADELRRLSERFSQSYRVATRLEADDTGSALERDVRQALVRAVHELLCNVGKHAEASEVVLQLGRQAGRLVVSVADNGRGISPQAAWQSARSPRGFGLAALRQMLVAMGCEVTVTGLAGSGTEVTISAPLAAEGGPER